MIGKEQRGFVVFVYYRDNTQIKTILHFKDRKDALKSSLWHFDNGYDTVTNRVGEQMGAATHQAK